MNKLLFASMTAYGRVFLALFLVAVSGFITAPNQQSAVALSWAALVAIIVAGLRAIQVFVPQISFKRFFPSTIGAWVDAFVLAFISSFITLLTGWLAAPDWSTWKSALLAVIVGALTAGIRALQGLSTAGNQPAPSVGM